MFQSRPKFGDSKPIDGNAKDDSGFVASSENLDEFRPFLRTQAESLTKGQIGRRFSRSDIVQETLMTAHLSLHQFRGNTRSEFAGWLRRILVNKFCTWLQRHTGKTRDLRRERDIDSFQSEPENLPKIRQKTPSKVLQLQEESEVVNELLQELPEHYRKVLDLRHNHDWSFRDIAAEFQKTEGAVRLIWLRAITRLRSLYGRRVD